ncbi:MAG: hypothetical protein ACK5II_03550, partial [Paracoccus sp. (in: a-proteobacteria)]
MSHPIAFRRHVLRVRERDGLSFAEVADGFSAGIASVTRRSKRPEPKTDERRPGRRIAPVLVAQDVPDQPDASLHGRAARGG